MFLKLFQSQSLFVQMARMLCLLIITIIGVRNYQPLMNALSEQAVNAGCHQGSVESHQRHDHHNH